MSAKTEQGFMSLSNWQNVGAEYRSAVEKHGERFATLTDGMDALYNEVVEVLDAEVRNDIDGEHGLRRELTHVIVVCIKILEGLRDGTNAAGEY